MVVSAMSISKEVMWLRSMIPNIAVYSSRNRSHVRLQAMTNPELGYEKPNAPEADRVVKLNYCSVSDLMSIDSIGTKRASAIIEYREKHGPYLTIEDLRQVPTLSQALVETLVEKLDWSFNGYFVGPPQLVCANANRLGEIIKSPVDLILTSPPYWKKRDYGHPNQLGQESSATEYVRQLCDIVDSWIPLLRLHSSIFLNIGDTFCEYSLAGIPALVEVELQRRGWLVVNRIIWSKNSGVPEPLSYRLADRHELIIQIARNREFYSDTSVLAEYMGQNSNPGDVWNITSGRNDSKHLAPFPEELVKRIIHFACPEHVCRTCSKPFRRRMEPTFELDLKRPQARRAIELFNRAGLSPQHLEAIRAVGISDAGKARRVQSGSDKNAEHTKKLAEEAKQVLRGYFREFTFGKKRQIGWEKCKCSLDTMPGVVLDPFMGSGTTVRVAHQLGRISIGSDLIMPDI